MYEHSNISYALGVDVGGSHIMAGLVNTVTGDLLEHSVRKAPIDGTAAAAPILNAWTAVIRDSLRSISNYQLCGIGIAMPGPFDYEEGVAAMKGMGKYESLFGMNIADHLASQLPECADLPIRFENDAACFGLGESFESSTKDAKRIIGITLGTGFGASFVDRRRILKEGKGIPPNGEMYNLPYLDGIAEDYISSRRLVHSYGSRTGKNISSAKEVAELAYAKDETAIKIFHEFGTHIGTCLAPWIERFAPDCLIIGGNISRAHHLFLPALKSVFQQKKITVPIRIADSTEAAAIKGAATLVSRRASVARVKRNPWRKSAQPLMPIQDTKKEKEAGVYELYPSFSIGSGKINEGYGSLAEWMLDKGSVMIDGFPGNDWFVLQEQLTACFAERDVRVHWYNTNAFLHPLPALDMLIEPFIGNPGDVWGTRTSLSLSDFFHTPALERLPTNTGADLHIVIGPGAAFANWKELVYIDLPKNEVQYRMRAGHPVTLSETEQLSNAEIYKRLYFVDWVISARHRQQIADRIGIIADGQWRDTITWGHSRDLYQGLQQLAASPIRPRPWFEPGAWGGQWLKKHIPALNPDVVNYAWSFELIAPENGVVFESNSHRLELSFDWLMEQAGEAVLGADFATYGTAFPIRFDFLDTVDGGNLSIQCHPGTEYIRSHFGEEITQDETYYILDCEKDATVYLGFQETIEPTVFRSALEKSVNENIALTITDFVQEHAATKHDLFLIPNQTIHSAGKGNLVLEISATPYIFTFKMYDWLRLDLDGNPRPINIEHAFANLNFSRKGAQVQRELISHPTVISESANCRMVHLPTHPQHFYDVHRIEFTGKVELDTDGKTFVLMLVEGDSMRLHMPNGSSYRFNYAETFVMPAAAGAFTIENETGTAIKLIKAFIK